MQKSFLQKDATHKEILQRQFITIQQYVKINVTLVVRVALQD